MLSSNVIKDPNPLLVLRIGDLGDLPNIEIKVNENSLLWDSEDTKNGYTLQRNIFTDSGRIIGPDGRRKGNGTMPVMKEKFKRLARKDFFEAGDVIGVSRAGFYEHYAVYIGNGRVIHYAGEGDDFGGKISVHEADMSEFMKLSDDCFVVCVIKGKLFKIRKATTFLIPADISSGYYRRTGWKAYSNEKTVERAKSRLREENYNIVLNNCEHFALWCKTGKPVSTQVEKITEYIDSLAEPKW